MIGQVHDAVIEYCEARYNGWDMPRKGNGPSASGRGRRTALSSSSASRTTTAAPGLTAAVSILTADVNSILQYNYSHDNHGSGYLICQYEGAKPFRNNIVRYNISQDDGLTNHNAGIYVWVGGKAWRAPTSTTTRSLTAKARPSRSVETRHTRSRCQG